jgi:hypothetical protein
VGTEYVLLRRPNGEVLSLYEMSNTFELMVDKPGKKRLPGVLAPDADPALISVTEPDMTVEETVTLGIEMLKVLAQWTTDGQKAGIRERLLALADEFK